MLDKPFSVLFGLGVAVFVGAILLESSPAARLEMTCAPVRWGGNVLGSVAALTDSEKWAEKIAAGTDDVDYGCQFTLWRLIYGKKYASAQASTTTAPDGRSVYVQPSGDPEILPAGGMSPTQGEQRKVGNEQHVRLVEKEDKK